LVPFGPRPPVSPCHLLSFPFSTPVRLRAGRASVFPSSFLQKAVRRGVLRTGCFLFPRVPRPLTPLLVLLFSRAYLLRAGRVLDVVGKHRVAYVVVRRRASSLPAERPTAGRLSSLTFFFFSDPRDDNFPQPRSHAPRALFFAHSCVTFNDLFFFTGLPRIHPLPSCLFP